MPYNHGYKALNKWNARNNPSNKFGYSFRRNEIISRINIWYIGSMCPWSLHNMSQSQKLTSFHCHLLSFFRLFHCHDDYLISFLSWWRHQMETFSASLALCEGNPPVTGGFPSQTPVTRSFDVFFYLGLNKWLNIDDAGDLRRPRIHYEVTVIFSFSIF